MAPPEGPRGRTRPRVLVTGSSGHLGEALVRTLRADGATVTGLDLRPSPFTTTVGSVTDRRAVQEAVADVDVVLHTATLHKPHVATHSRQEFVDTNVTGTLVLLEAAVAAGVGAFVLTSTTSTFGRSLVPPPGGPAVWVTEDLAPRPRNVYGATKLAAELVAEEFHHSERLPVVVLRTGRFFPEPDDRPEIRAAYADENAKANELLHRRVDIADVVDAHLRAAERAGDIGFARYVISATPPFGPGDVRELATDPAGPVARAFPDQPDLYGEAGWALPASIQRVYSNARAREELGWEPRHTFGRVLDALRSGSDWRSELAREVGIKGYHGGAYPDGLYPVRDG